MKRVLLVCVMAALMVAAIGLGALSGTAQEKSLDPSGGAVPVEEALEKSAAPVEEVEEGLPGEVLFCTPEWFEEYYRWSGPAGQWWYFWWYKWCYDPFEDEWLKVYDGWEWWGPVED